MTAGSLHLKSFLVSALLSFFFLFNSVSGQNIARNKDKVNGKPFTYLVMETDQLVKGILLLLPSLGEKPANVYKKTQLPQLLSQKGFITIVPELSSSLFADAYTLAELNQIIKVETEKYHLNAPALVLGGLSAGGSVAISYAEYLLNSDKASDLKGVFSVDAPLDFTRIYVSAERKIKYQCAGLIQKEGYSTINYLNTTFNGNPALNPSEYLKHSPFSAHAADGGQAKALQHIPVRLYTEPDLTYVRKTYCEDLQLEDMNAIDQENLSKFLRGLGNQYAEYIPTKGRGFHSWNIIEPAECTDWILKISL